MTNEAIGLGFQGRDRGPDKHHQSIRQQLDRNPKSANKQQTLPTAASLWLGKSCNLPANHLSTRTIQSSGIQEYPMSQLLIYAQTISLNARRLTTATTALAVVLGI